MILLMKDKIRNIAIITKNLNDLAAEFEKRITKLLLEKNIKVYSFPPFEISGTPTIPLNFKSVEDVDLIICLGGDGTTLRAFRFYPSNIPVFSINVGGTRGILSEIKVDLINSAIDALIKGDFFFDERLRIQVSSENQLFPPALNDVLLFRSNLTRTPTFTIKYRGDKIVQRMDGILISTPTGSTGHCLSLGGPILHEELYCLIINPIASLNKLPQFIVPPDDIEIICNNNVDLIVDGQDRYLVNAEEPITIKRYEINAKFIRLRKKGLRQLEKLGF